METFPTGPRRGIKSIWVVIITVVIMLGLAGGAYYYLNQKFTKEKKDLQNQINDLNKQIADAKKTTAATPATTTTTPTPTTTASNMTYANSTYGFGLTFNSKWANWKVKYVKIDGATATYYIEVPTTDANYAEGSSIADAGYATLFAISVYTPAEWAAIPADAPSSETKLTENANYVFSWSHAQACPDDVVAKGVWDDINNVIASFKLN